VCNDSRYVYAIYTLSVCLSRPEDGIIIPKRVVLTLKLYFLRLLTIFPLFDYTFATMEEKIRNTTLPSSETSPSEGSRNISKSHTHSSIGDPSGEISKFVSLNHLPLIMDPHDRDLEIFQVSHLSAIESNQIKIEIEISIRVSFFRDFSWFCPPSHWYYYQYPFITFIH
jgi:hypothetical protein